MAKTREELDQLKIEYESLNNKLKELTEDELKQVIGGTHDHIDMSGGSMVHPPVYGEVTSDGKINPASTIGWFSVADDNK